MFPYHHIPVTLPDGENTVAFFARRPAGRLVIFVHGFRGKSTETWAQMHELLPLRAKSAGYDIVFYGYDSLRVQAMLSAALLGQFIKKFISNKFARPGSADMPTSYDVLIVAHSLGALISRQTVLNAYTVRPRENWVERTRLLLFGPAHRGAKILELKKAITNSLGGWSFLSTLATWAAAPILTDLEEESPFVKDLFDGSNKVRKTKKKSPFVADLVVFGENDQVVTAKIFCREEPIEAVPGKGHVDVCKPTATYTTPLDRVEALL